MRIGLSLLLLITVLALAVPASAKGDLRPEQLTYLTEEYFPFNYTADGGVQGFSVDLLRLVWREMEVPVQDISVLPWARAYETVLQEDRTVLFSMARTPERENLFKWVGPIHSSRFSLFARKQSKIVIDSLNDLEGYTIGTVRSDIGHMVLEPHVRAEQLQPVADMEQNLLKLLAGRLDLVVYEESSMRQFLELNGYAPDLLVPIYLLKEISTYYAFSKSTPEALIQRFQKALDAVKGTPRYTQLLEYHSLGTP